MTLADLKPGDSVIEERNNVYGCNRTIYVVIRVTKTTLWIGQPGSEGVRYRRDNGRQVGWLGYGAPTAIPATPELIAEVEAERRRRTLVRLLRDTKWDQLSLSTLDQIVALLP